MTIRRWVLWPLAGIVMMALLATAALYWASRSETALRWGVERIAVTLPCSLTVQGIRGAYMKPVSVQFLICENAQYRIEARNIALAWSPWALAHQRLDVTGLHLDELAYTSKPGAPQTEKPTPLQPPQSLALPIAIDVASLTISTLVVTLENENAESGTNEHDVHETGASETSRIVLNAIDATYQGDAQTHRLELRSLASPWGRAAGNVTIGASPPLSLAATLSVSSDRIEGWPVSADIGLSGELQQIDAVITALAGPVQVNGELALAPFSDQPLQSLSANASNIDAAAFDPRLPQTVVSATVTATMTSQLADGLSLTGHLHVENADSGRVDQQRLPVQVADADFALDTSSLRLSDLRVDLGAAGYASGNAQLMEDRIALAVDVRDLDLRAAHGDLRQSRLNGSIRVDHGDGRQMVAVDLRQKDMQIEGSAEVSAEIIKFDRVTARAGGARLLASGSIRRDETFGYTVNGTVEDFDPARFGDFPQAKLNGTLRAQGELRPDWNATLQFRVARSQLKAIALSGGGTARVTRSHVQDADMRIDYGGNKLTLKGSFGNAGDTLDFSLDAPRLDRLEKTAKGQLQLSGTVGGTRTRPSITAKLQAHKLVYGDFHVDEAQADIALTQTDDPAIRVQALLRQPGRGDLAIDSIEATVDGTSGSHVVNLSVAAPDILLVSRLDGAWDWSRRVWSGTLVQLENSKGDYPFRMTRAASLELAPDHVHLGATAVTFSIAELELGETRFGNDGLRATGTIKGVRAARVLALMEKPPAIDSTLVLGGRWEIEAKDTVDGFIELARTDGDIVIPGEEPLALELEELRVTLRAAANQLTAEAILRSTQIDASGSAQTRLEKRGAKLGISGNAPLALQGEMQMRSIRPIAALASRAVTADGSLKMTIKGGGTVSQPQLSGSVEGDDIKIEDVANGVFFGEGVLRAKFDDDALTLTQLSLKGGDGELTASGRFSTRKGAPLMDLRWTTDQLAIIQHPDLRLTVTGAGQLDYKDEGFSLIGALTADQGRVELRNRTLPSLGDDVVISGQETRSQLASDTKRTRLDLKLGLGPDFTIVGRGLDARLEGQIQLTSAADKPLSADGEIRVATGTFEAYGRRLQIDEGALYFAGPVSNPGINIRAMRKNQTVEAGVEVTGTARDPRVRLVSDPDVPDPDKLAWLVLGRPAESGNTQDGKTLQSSAVALAAGLGTSPLQAQLARSVGLDEITFMPGTGDSEGGVVAVGKQISDKIYVTQEFGVRAASNTLRVSYQLTRRWSVRTESGDTDAVDLFFTISFD